VGGLKLSPIVVVRERERGGRVAVQVVVRAIDLVADRLELGVLAEQEVLVVGVESRMEACWASSFAASLRIRVLDSRIALTKYRSNAGAGTIRVGPAILADSGAVLDKTSCGGALKPVVKRKAAGLQPRDPAEFRRRGRVAEEAGGLSRKTAYLAYFIKSTFVPETAVSAS
jgi:hypothetical protein